MSEVECPEPVEGQVCRRAGLPKNGTMPQHYVYVLRCADGSYYVGSTHNLEERMHAHHEGRAAAHTFKHRPVSLVYSESVASEELAIRRERQIKGWSRAKKEVLINGDLERLKDLSRCR